MGERGLLLLLASVLAAFVWSGIAPHDRFTWVLETVPVAVAIPLLWATRRRFPLTALAYLGTAFFALILLVGGHYTYARTPLGFWMADWFGFERNHYDRMGHFFQGFVPAILARELLLRTSPLRPGKWLAVLVCAVALAISACYEFIEWWAAALTGTAADQFVGSQGDVWDAQWDMFLALCGSIAFQALLGRLHQRQVERL
jgi:putative membrane protein